MDGVKVFVPRPLCPYNENGLCPDGDRCEFLHGLACDLCDKNCLHPHNIEQQKQHRRECLANHEEAMEEAFAHARTSEKTCGICLENVWEKNKRFGILQNCSHCFCLECIRQWRKSREGSEVMTTRSCPECRTHSDFIIPCCYWVEDRGEKEHLIGVYQANTKQKRCKYFQSGNRDSCKFGNKCFYRHEDADGALVECDSPHVIARRLRRRQPRLDSFLELGFRQDYFEFAAEEDFMVAAFYEHIYGRSSSTSSSTFAVSAERIRLPSSAEEGFFDS
ncbi:hypothetical protein L596_012984 [Steinernema carpocapsae]|uniref:RING-type E3 ubiquitin transferase n=1 Tax=Steinernema carpocapsae TaxID=34508 RepID=A0A4U5NYQ5_STECR|nr:hypothetical protein L596_012984 [Steinernema carpocapsae]